MSIFSQSEQGKNMIMAESRKMSESIARINESDIRRLEARMDAKDRIEAEAAEMISQEERDKEEKVKEAMRYMRSGRHMPQPEGPADEGMGEAQGASSASSTQAPQPTADEVPAQPTERRQKRKTAPPTIEGAEPA